MPLQPVSPLTESESSQNCLKFGFDWWDCCEWSEPNLFSLLPYCKSIGDQGTRFHLATFRAIQRPMLLTWTQSGVTAHSGQVGLLDLFHLTQDVFSHRFLVFTSTRRILFHHRFFFKQSPVDGHFSATWDMHISQTFFNCAHPSRLLLSASVVSIEGQRKGHFDLLVWIYPFVHFELKVKESMISLRVLYWSKRVFVVGGTALSISLEKKSLSLQGIRFRLKRKEALIAFLKEIVWSLWMLIKDQEHA